MAATSHSARPVRNFLTYLKVEAGLAPATIDAYAADLRDLALHLGEDALAKPDVVDARALAEHMRWLHRERGLAPSSITRHLATLRVFFRFLHANDLTSDNPARLLERPHQWKRLPGVLSPKQMRLLIDAANPDAGRLWMRDRAMLELMYAAGLRASEVGRLEVQEYNTTLGVLLVTGKGSKQRMVPIGEPAQQATDCYLDELRPKLARFNDGRDARRLLLSNNGHPLERVAVWQIVRKYARRAGLKDVHPHRLRHSFATHLLAGGADLRVVQELLGHADVSTTQVYTHVDRSHLLSVIQKHHPRP